MTSLTDRIGNRYHLLDQIGAGGMGIVYRAHDQLTDTIIALKRVTISKEHLITNSVSDSTQQSQLALASEFRTLATLRHPHIISVLDYGFDDDQHPYFTMELLEDAQLVTEVAPHLRSDQKLMLIVEMLQALAYLHRRGILHRDLKPENVLVTQSLDNTYHAKVVDFGLAITPDFDSVPDKVVGTLAYLAPEILQMQPANRTSDLYAIGMLMFEILAGHHPFETTQITELMQAILYTRPRTNVPGIDRLIGSVIRRLLDKTPEKRYQNAESTLNAIRQATDLDITLESTAVRESFLQSAKFVGREPELMALTQVLQRAKQGEGSIWLVGGESGVGKSRLLDEIRTLALVDGLLVVRGQAVSNGGMSYQIWRDVLRRLMLSSSITDEQASILKEIVPDIERLLNRPVTDAPQLSETTHQERLGDMIVQVISNLHLPTLLVLEDLHWASDALEPLHQLSGKISDLSVTVMGSYRSDDFPDFHESIVNANIMMLDRLSLGEMKILSESMIGSVAQQTNIIELLERETEGNTFFIVEVMRALAEDAGQLDSIGRVTLPSSVFTGGINAVIKRRIDRVPIAYQPLLSLTAVIGRQLDLAILQVVIESHDDYRHISLDEWLSACESAVVISVQDEQWHFSHDKLREHLLQGMTDTRHIYERIATAITTVYPDDTARYATLAELWLNADDVRQAIHYAIPASKQMQLVSNYQGAIALFDRILMQWNRDNLDTGVQCDVLNRIGELHERMGEYEIAHTYFDRSYLMASELDDPLRLTDALLGQGTVAYSMGSYDNAHQYLQTAVDIGKDIAPRETLSLIYKMRSNVYSVQDNFSRSNEYLISALEVSRAIDYKIEIAGCLNNLGVNEYLMGNYDVAREYYRQALDVYTEIGYRSGMALCYSNLGDVTFKQGVDVQLSYYIKGLDIYRDIGNKWGIALCLENVGSTYYMQGRYEEALAAFNEGLTISRTIGDTYAAQYTLMNIGMVHNLQHNYQLADEAINQSLATARELNIGSNLALCLSFSAFNDIDLQLYERAQEKLREGIAIILQSESDVALLEIFASSARLMLVREDYLTSAILCEFLLNNPALEHVTLAVVVRPVHERLKDLMAKEDYQSAVHQAQALDMTLIVNLLQSKLIQQKK